MKLDLALEEVNLILTSLGRMPYEAVFEIVEKIKAQALPQINKPSDKPAEVTNLDTK